MHALLASFDAMAEGLHFHPPAAARGGGREIKIRSKSTMCLRKSVSQSIGGPSSSAGAHSREGRYRICQTDTEMETDTDMDGDRANACDVCRGVCERTRIRTGTCVYWNMGVLSGVYGRVAPAGECAQ